VKTVRTTVVGGLVFLVPFAITLLVFGKVFTFMRRLAGPLSTRIPIESVGGIALANILALAIMLAACFLAGIVATSSWGQRIYRRVDEKMLDLIPRYAFVKSMTEGLGGQDEVTLKPVLVRFDDISQIAFEVERGPGDLVTVYLPGSPDPWSGSVALVTSDRIDALAESFAPVVKSLRKVGKGASALIGTAVG
jgi:uncharacterized membrane protein